MASISSHELSRKRRGGGDGGRKIQRGRGERDGKEVGVATHTKKRKKEKNRDALMMQSQGGQSCVMHDDVKHEEPASSPSLCHRQEHEVNFKHKEISHTYLKAQK